MNKPNEHDLLLDYFNNALSEVEQARFEKHLNTCTECQEELAELTMLTEDLPFAAEAIEPNEGMKDRVLAAVFAEPATENTDEAEQHVPQTKTKTSKPKRWLQPLLAASLLISAGANAYFLLNKDTAVTDPGPSTARVLTDVQLAATEGFNGSARATIVEEKESESVIVQAEQLRAVSGTEAYQVWLIDEAGNKVRAGTFRPNEGGAGAVSYPMPELEQGSWQMIAVTLEPTPESEQPLGDIVLAAEL